MKVLVKIGSIIRTYPYRERVPLAVGLAAVTAWVNRDLWRFAGLDGYVSMVAVFLALLCTSKGRPFWLFVGIATGALLPGELGLLHSKAGPFFAGGLAIMIAVVWLLRRLNPGDRTITGETRNDAERRSMDSEP